MKLFLFDCDGTLVDSQQNIVDAMQFAFNSKKIKPPSDQAIRNIIGISLEEAVAKLLNQSDIDALCLEIVQSYRSCARNWRVTGQLNEPLYDGIDDIIRTLHKVDDVLLGVATGKSLRGLEHIVEEKGWQNHFHTLQTSDQAPSKPHPGMVYNALSETGADAINTVMIGDTSYDMQMGQSAGVKTIAVTWGYHSQDELEKHKPNHIVHTRAELKDLLMHWKSV